MQIDIWSDVACPWCFIGKRRFETALGAWEHRDEVQVTWHSFQLDPSLPEHYDGTEVDYLANVKGMPVAQVQQMLTHVTEQAAGEGLRYDFDRLVVANSLRAHQLLHLAKAHGLADAVKDALLSAHFEQGVDIGDVDALVTIGARAGLAAKEIREALADERHLPAVREDIAQARQIGVTGVPFFVFDMRLGLSGAQPAEVFTQALDRARELALEEAAPVAE
ncbi:DsbA family oxidoreductase [Agrococcus carbonis]|uniref:Predicted dithiol-disulfide isomerase, DsbA family n=1 Tax=Agrococcus carbonis TaxID=684552 RepID=A0A1H1LM51_9MICO|nr:DsbA family oxidoreductase [Agrococcus carbonis]SDR75603.1 Predicted dithiol-disulfide isomerase, DsbA family [Agrococcus carbonis]